MSREVRRVPANWMHPVVHEPRESRGKAHDYVPRFVGLFDGYNTDRREYDEMARAKGIEEADNCIGAKPDPEHYMPDWPEEERTHFQMYETTSEGTPISPPMPTEEALADWLVDNKASTFGHDAMASRKGWLRMIRLGSAPTAVGTVYADGTTELMSGVEDMSNLPAAPEAGGG